MLASTMGTAGGGGLTQFGESGLVFHALCIDDDVAGFRQLLRHLPERQFNNVGCNITHPKLKKEDALVAMRFEEVAVAVYLLLPM